MSKKKRLVRLTEINPVDAFYEDRRHLVGITGTWDEVHASEFGNGFSAGSFRFTKPPSFYVSWTYFAAVKWEYVD